MESPTTPEDGMPPPLKGPYPAWHSRVRYPSSRSRAALMTLPERSSRETSGRPKANNFCWIFFIKFTGWSETRDRIRVTLGSRGRYLSHSVWRLALKAYLNAHLRFSRRKVVLYPTACLYLLIGAWFSRTTTSWELMAAPNLVVVRMPLFPTSAHESNWYLLLIASHVLGTILLIPLVVLIASSCSGSMLNWTFPWCTNVSLVGSTCTLRRVSLWRRITVGMDTGRPLSVGYARRLAGHSSQPLSGHTSPALPSSSISAAWTLLPTLSSMGCLCCLARS
mmetsp:Transcript_36404/g.68557  ORF Transcript_36404/g.68557 Transcript_36404/m.68557 type:complete len:279 (-) Transcript_36404:296-1132(-)